MRCCPNEKPPPLATAGPLLHIRRGREVGKGPTSLTNAEHPAGGCYSAARCWIDHPGIVPTNVLFGFNTLVPFISQIATLPEVSCHRMSLTASPLKSPVPAIDHWPGTVATNELFWFKMVVPFISQIATLPDVSIHRMSALPSPLKSPVPAIDHWVGTLETDGLFGFNIVAPF